MPWSNSAHQSPPPQQQQQKGPVPRQQAAQQGGGGGGGGCIQVPGTSSGPYAARGELPEEVYRQIRQVDQQQSTLTAKGVQGFSARVLDRSEYRAGGYSNDIRVVQLLEIIKKPGQSLGLYLREGNGIDQFTGVFVSRFGENSELERCGDIIRPGDQILAVNNVQVKEMAIDDVVLMLSIPRRLLLRTSYLKSQREQHANLRVERVERPVVVFQKSSDSDRRDSEASSSGILSKPASTAASWLGKRIRHQQQQKQQEKPQENNVATTNQAGQPIRQRQYPPPAQCAISDAVAQTARIPPPRVQPIQQPIFHSPFAPGQFQQSAAYVPRHPAYSSATLGRLPPASAPIQRRIFGQAHSLVGSSIGPYGIYGPSPGAASFPASFPAPSSARTVIGGVPNSSSQTMQMPMPPPPYQPPHQMRRPNNAPFPGAGQFPSGLPAQMPAYKSNSLPRRSAFGGGIGGEQRTVKWRNDFVGDGLIHPAASVSPSAAAFYGPPPGGGRGAFSDVDANIGRCQTARHFLPNGTVGTGARTVADIFSAQEYRNWASEDEDVGGGGHRSRWNTIGPGGASIRSNSLPSKTIMANHQFGDSSLPRVAAGGQQSDDRSYGGGGGGPSQQQFSINQQQQQQIEAIMASKSMSAAEKADILDRLHVSPLMNRRVPLRTAGPGFDVDRLSGNSTNSLTGILSVTIVEGRNLKVPDRVHSKQLYCVLEVNEMHRARTGISTPEQHFRWAERFDIDVFGATEASFFVYAWHPQLRHRFCHKGDMRLLDLFLVDGLSGNRLFTLNVEPRGQLLLKVAFMDMGRCFCRVRQAAGIFGQPLNLLVQREQVEVPLVMRRLVGEIERRGLDTPGLYYLCGANERKGHLRAQFNENSREADISERPVPDVNLLTCLLKDFLRELPEPLVPANIHPMLLDAAGVMPPTDREGNQKLVMRIVDCLPSANKNSLVFLMDHLRNLLGSEPHNGLTMQRLTSVFGPLIFCTANPAPNPTANAPKPLQMPSGGASSLYQSSVQVDPLSVPQSAQALRLLLDHWPRVNSSSDSDSNNATNEQQRRQGQGQQEEVAEFDGKTNEQK